MGKPLGMRRHNLHIDNASLPWVDKFIYLGVTFIAGNTLLKDCKPRIQKFISAVYSVLRCKTVGFGIFIRRNFDLKMSSHFI